MKRLFLPGIIIPFLLVPALFNPISAQDKNSYYYVGATGSGHMAFIANQNNYGGRELEYKLNTGNSYGIYGGKDWNNKHKIEIGIGFLSAGQQYGEAFNNLDYLKRVNLQYIQIPLIYKYMIGSASKFHREEIQFHAGAGLTLAFLNEADVQWEIDGLPSNFLDFVGGTSNPRYEEILANGIPEDEKELYNSVDVMVTLNGGILYFLTDAIGIEGFVFSALSISDINAPAWRMKNRNEEYSGSRNLLLGMQISVMYYFYNW